MNSRGVRDRLSENDLILAHLWSHQPIPRVEPCACGGVITAPDDEPTAVARAVLSHNLSPQHERWREVWA